MAVNIKKEFGNTRNRKPDLTSLVYGKVPPQAPEMEEAVLGAVLLEKGAFDIAADILKENSFYVDANQKIWAACVRLFIKGSPIDLLTVTEALRKENELELVGGPYYLTRLTISVVSSAHVEAHARVIQEKYMQRELIRIAGTIISDAYMDSTDVFDLMGNAESQMFELITGNVQSTYKSSRSLAHAAMERVEFLMNNKSEITGIPTGYPALDALTCGWQPTDLIILAARPSVGKTAFMLNMGVYAAQHEKKPTGIGIFSLEMSADQLTQRAISSLSKISLEFIRNGRLNQKQLQDFTRASQHFANLNIKIDDTGGIDIFNLRAKARRMVSRDNVGMIMIDYLQLMSGLHTKSNNREQELSQISRELKTLAKELQVPIIALSQMNRSIETRGGNKEPMLSDLRESGSIEQDADVVAFLTRADYQKKEDELNPMIKDDAYVHFAKHRNGKLMKLAFKTKLDIQTWFDLDGYDHYTGAQNIFGSWRPVNSIPDLDYKTAQQPKEKDDLPF